MNKVVVEVDIREEVIVLTASNEGHNTVRKCPTGITGEVLGDYIKDMLSVCLLCGHYWRMV